MNTEPIGEVALIVAFVGSVITALVAFGINVTQEQTAAILGIIVAAGPLAVWYQARKKTTPVTKANERIEKAAETGVAKPL